MRKIWVKVDPWDKELVKTALEGGADGIMVPAGYSDQVKALGRIETISEDGDLKPGEDVIVYQIQSGADEEEIVRLARDKRVILEISDWSIIPLCLSQPMASVMNSPRGVRMKAPTIGPNNVPTPPTIGPSVNSMDRSILKVESGNMPFW